MRKKEIKEDKIIGVDFALKSVTDKIFDKGIRNGQQIMKNRVLEKINTDWSLIKEKNPRELIIKILNKIVRIKIV